MRLAAGVPGRDACEAADGRAGLRLNEVEHGFNAACLRGCLSDGGDGAVGGAAAAGPVPMEVGGEAAHRGLNAAAPTGGQAEERAASVAEELLMEAFRQRQVRGLREWWPSFLAVQAECACVHPTVEAILHEALYVDW